jgi:hypothetical protein
VQLKKYRRMIWLGVGLGLLAFIGVALLSDITQVIKYARAFPWIVMVVVLALRCGNWAIRWAKWVFLLRLVGVKTLKPRDSGSIFIAGLAMATSPGKIAEFLKCFIVKNLTGVPIVRTIPTILAERTTDGMAIVLLLVVAIAAIARSEYLPLAVFSILLNIAAVVILSIRPLCLWLLAIVVKLPLVGRFADGFRTLYESSYVIFRPRNWLIAVSTGLCSSSLDGIGMFLILVGLGKPATAETFFIGLMAVTLSVVTGSLSGMPSGVGVSDATIGGVLILQMGMSAAEAGFATLLARFAQSWWGVLVGLAVIALDRARLFPPSLERIMQADSEGPQALVKDISTGSN